MRLPLVLLIFLLLFLIYNSPMLLYPVFQGLNPCKSPTEVILKGKTLFISDLHIKDLGELNPRFRVVGAFARKEGLKNVVVVGDFIDSPRLFNTYGGKEEAFKTMARALGLEDERLFFITGTPVHDPQDMEVGVHGNVNALGKCGVFDINGTKVIAYHGDHISRHGSLGFGVSYITKSLFLERMWKALAGIDNDAMLIMGHTHVQGLNEKAGAGNPGGWKKIPFFNPPRGRGILIGEEGFKLVKITEDMI